MYTLFEIVSSLPISDSENRTLGVKHVQVSINYARKNMHDYIIDNRVLTALSKITLIVFIRSTL